MNSNDLKVVYLGEFRRNGFERFFDSLNVNESKHYTDVFSFLEDFYMDLLDYETIVIVGGFTNKSDLPIDEIRENVALLFDEDEIVEKTFNEDDVVCGHLITAENKKVMLLPGDLVRGKATFAKINSYIESGGAVTESANLNSADDVAKEKPALKMVSGGKGNKPEDEKENDDSEIGNIEKLKPASVISFSGKKILDDIKLKMKRTGTNSNSSDDSLSKQAERIEIPEDKSSLEFNVGSSKQAMAAKSAGKGSKAKLAKEVGKKAGKTLIEKIQIGVLSAAAVAFLVSGGYLVYHQFVEPMESQKVNSMLVDIYNEDKDKAESNSKESKDDNKNKKEDKKDTSSSSKEFASGEVVYNGNKENKVDDSIPASFQSLYELNDDVVGWLYVPNTPIDYPVVLTDNNDFYIDHDYMKNYNRYGALFADCDNVITPQKTSDNISIYGHNMLDGSMFGELEKFRDLSFLKSNPYFTFNNLHEDGVYVIYSVFVTNPSPEQDNGNMFEWRISDFSSKDSFDSYITKCKKRSLFNIQIDVKPDDKLISLSTCAYDFDDARLVVAARKVRDGEAIDFSNVKVNESILYPQVWYDVHGGTKPVIQKK